MTGDKTPETSRGIIPRGCEELFNRISNTNDPSVSYEVRVSFLELYNEKLQDLLDPKTTKTIKIRESTKKGVYVENALEEPVSSYNDIDKLLEAGNKVRTVAATAMNATSSRSHSILTVFFTKKTVCFLIPVYYFSILSIPFLRNLMEQLLKRTLVSTSLI